MKNYKKCKQPKHDEAMTEGITAPLLNNCQSPSPCHLIKVLAKPDPLGQGRGPNKGTLGKVFANSTGLTRG